MYHVLEVDCTLQTPGVYRSEFSVVRGSAPLVSGHIITVTAKFVHHIFLKMKSLYFEMKVIMLGQSCEVELHLISWEDTWSRVSVFGVSGICVVQLVERGMR